MEQPLDVDTVLLQMLGQAYQEVITENGNKPPHFGMSTVLDLASKLWLKSRALERGKTLNPAFSAQVGST